MRNAKKIAFRVDATSQIGTGHFMRCYTLALELKAAGFYVRFVSRNLPEHLCNMLLKESISFVTLVSDEILPPDNDLAHSGWLGTSQEQDAKISIKALSDYHWDWLIVDHYALDVRWESVLRGSTRQLMVIDDIADRKHDCDVLLDQNLYVDMQTRYVDKLPAHCKQLLGPRYALLRDEFRVARGQLRPRSGIVKNILVFFGGVDTNNYTELALQALVDIAHKELHVDVVIGAQHPYREKIQLMCNTNKYVCHVQTTNMAKLMAKADLAIGAGGTAIWERCCLGLPTLSVCVSSNQRKQIQDASTIGLLYSPSSDNDLMNVLRRHILALIENISLLKHISNNAIGAVDGLGVIRTTEILNLREINIRKAYISDSLNLYEWRNHPIIRAVSRNSASITWEEHQLWLKNVLADKDRELLIGYFENEPVGIVRFDKKLDIAEVSIYLVPECPFKGIGRSLIFSAERWIKENRCDIKRVRAEVLAENEKSKKLFSTTNYKLEKISYLKEL